MSGRILLFVTLAFVIAIVGFGGGVLEGLAHLLFLIFIAIFFVSLAGDLRKRSGFSVNSSLTVSELTTSLIQHQAFYFVAILVRFKHNAGKNKTSNHSGH